MLQRRWTNADGEKVGLWMSLGIIITIILFTVLLGSLNIYLGKPLSKLRDIEDEQAARDTRAETLAQEIQDLRDTLTQRTEASDAAVRDKQVAERQAAAATQTFNTQQELVQQQNDRIASLVRERDEKIEELRQRTDERDESRLRVGESMTENRNLRNNMRDVETQRSQLERECDRLRMQLNFATEQMARHQRHCNLDDEE